LLVVLAGDHRLIAAEGLELGRVVLQRGLHALDVEVERVAHVAGVFQRRPFVGLRTSAKDRVEVLVFEPAREWRPQALADLCNGVGDGLGIEGVEVEAALGAHPPRSGDVPVAGAHGYFFSRFGFTRKGRITLSASTSSAPSKML